MPGFTQKMTSFPSKSRSESEFYSLELLMIQDYEDMLNQLEKPHRCNSLELKIEKILLSTRDFFCHPSHAKKDVVLRLVSQTSASETDMRGFCGYSDRFNIVLSLIYLYGYYMKLPELKLYAYRCMVLVALEEHAVGILRDQFKDSSSSDSYNPKSILTNLYLYYSAYKRFRYSDFADDSATIYSSLLNVSDMYISGTKDYEVQVGFVSSAMQIVYDLAMTTGYGELDASHSYSKNDICSVFLKFSEWIEKYPTMIARHYNFCTRISITLVSMVLRLRNKLDNFPVLKYISDVNLKNSFDNNQVWIHEISKLNDPREGKPMEEILSDEGALCYSWQRTVSLGYQNYIGCFSRNRNASEMNQYGENGLGYRNDNIATKLAPVFLDEYGYPMFARVLSYDVSYSKETVRDELGFISNIIDNLPVSDGCKTIIFSMCVSRIKYSIKDECWSNEQERRYVIETQGIDEFIDAKKEDGFIKIESSLYLNPDFLVSFSDCFYKRFEENALVHVTEDVSVPCALCMDCLLVNYHRNVQTCPQCGGGNLKFFDGISSFKQSDSQI